MFAFNWGANQKMNTGKNDTYVCGWLIENRSFLSVIEEAALVKIFNKLIYLIDSIAEELDERYRENGFAVDQEAKVKENARHLRQICYNLRSYGFIN